MVYFIEYLYYVHLYLFWCWARKSNLISVCFCRRFSGIYALLENIFRLAARRTYQFLFWLSYYKVNWIIKCFFVVSFLWLNLEMMNHDNSPILCTVVLEVLFIVLCSFIKNFFWMMKKMITLFLLILVTVGVGWWWSEFKCI